MTNEPQKRFPRVSECCKAKTHIFDDIKTQQVFLICSACDTPCRAVADEGLPTNEKSEKSLNPGIQKTVEWLNGLGFKTTDSGDGKTHDFGCDQPCSYVHIMVSPENLIHETIKLKMELKVKGIDVMPMNEENSVPCILSEYNPAEKFATISLYNVMI